jgi:hypothetical protein
LEENHSRFYVPKMVGNHYCLILDEIKLLVLKIDYDSFQVRLISRHLLGFKAFNIVVYQLNTTNFLVYNRNEFITGSLIDDKIVCSPKREFEFVDLKYSKLDGNTLSGIRVFRHRNDAGVRLYEYRNIDLTTLVEKIVEAPFTLNNYRLLSNPNVSFLFF